LNETRNARKGSEMIDISSMNSKIRFCDVKLVPLLENAYGVVTSVCSQRFSWNSDECRATIRFRCWICKLLTSEKKCNLFEHFIQKTANE